MTQKTAISIHVAIRTWGLTQVTFRQCPKLLQCTAVVVRRFRTPYRGMSVSTFRVYLLTVFHNLLIPFVPRTTYMKLTDHTVRTSAARQFFTPKKKYRHFVNAELMAAGGMRKPIRKETDPYHLHRYVLSTVYRVWCRHKVKQFRCFCAGFVKPITESLTAWQLYTELVREVENSANRT
jgi:hypothetical protein